MRSLTVRGKSGSSFQALQDVEKVFLQAHQSFQPFRWVSLIARSFAWSGVVLLLRAGWHVSSPAAQRRPASVSAMQKGTCQTFCATPGLLCGASGARWAATSSFSKPSSQQVVINKQQVCDLPDDLKPGEHLTPMLKSMPQLYGRSKVALSRMNEEVVNDPDIQRHLVFGNWITPAMAPDLVRTFVEVAHVGDVEFTLDASEASFELSHTAWALFRGDCNA